MSFIVDGGTQNFITEVFIQDTGSTMGSGLTGLSSTSPGLTCYYHRNTEVSPVNVPLRSMTVGTYLASGFAEISSSLMGGFYQICLPNAAYGTGAQMVSMFLQGASGMLPTPMRFQLGVNATITNSGISRSSYSSINELSSGNLPTWPMNPYDILAFMMMRSYHKSQTTAPSGGYDVFFKYDSTTPVASGQCIDDNITFTRNRYQ